MSPSKLWLEFLDAAVRSTLERFEALARNSDAAELGVTGLSGPKLTRAGQPGHGEGTYQKLTALHGVSSDGRV